MSQRSRREVRVVGEIKPISDKARLVWERYYAPMQGAAHALNQAIANTQNVLAGVLMEMDGVSPETHILDVEKMRYIPRPRATGGGNGQVD